MAKRKTPPRYKSGPKKGQFMSKRARAARKGGKAAARKTTRKRTRRNPGRTVARKTTTRKRRTTRRNPPKKRMDFVGSLVDGGIEATQVLIGKALARSIPDLVGAPKQGNIGLAIQAAVALASGYAAEMFVSPQAARAIMAGGLTAPIETLVVAYNVPFLAPALAPVTAQASVGAYVMGRNGPAIAAGRSRGVGRYVDEDARGIGAYASNGRA